MMDDNGDDDFASLLMTYNTDVINSFKAEPMMALDGEESALILNGEEKDILATARKICAEQTQCTDEVENANEGEEVPKEAPIICAEKKGCTNDGGDNEDDVTGGEEVGAKGFNVCVEEEDSIDGGLQNRENANEEKEMLDKALNFCAEEKEGNSGAMDDEEMEKETPEAGDQEDDLEMTGEEGEEGAAHGNTLEKIAEEKQVKAKIKNTVNKLNTKRKVIKKKKATPIGSRVIPKSTNKEALNKSLKNKTDAAADGETDNKMNSRGVDNGGNGDGRMSNEEKKKLTNIETGEGKVGDVEKADEEVANDNEAKEGVDKGKQVKAKPKPNVKQLQKSKLRRKKKEGGLVGVDARVPRNMKEQASPHKKADKEGKTMGMIFMCSSKTKQDCYHYKIMGLPASKRDLVLSIHEGMKLFLFDVNLKLMFGIYRAAGPGGYNIEPKAFNSAFPSQVRFAVEEDCLPLPEEKFKTVIKDNYYQKNKFKAELTLGQVNGLCKLFQAASKSPNSKRSSLKKNIRQLPPKSAEKDRKRNLQRARAENSVADRDRNKKRHREVERSGPIAIADRDRPKKRSRKNDKPRTHTFVDHNRPRTHTFVDHSRPRQQHLELERYPAYVRDVAYRDAPVAYERRPYVSSVAPLEFHPQLPAHAVPPPYAYDINVDMNVPRRPTLLEHHDRSFVETDWRHQEDLRRQEDIEYRRALSEYDQGRLGDSEHWRLGVEQLHHRERPPYYDQRYSAVQPAYYDAGRMHRDPAAPQLDYQSLRSTYRY